VSLEILTYRGLRLKVGKTSPEELRAIIAPGRGEGRDLSQAGLAPRPVRRSGYNLDNLLPENGFNVARKEDHGPLGPRLRGYAMGLLRNGRLLRLRERQIDVSVRPAERVMLPRIRAADSDCLILADGFSCREQIEQGSGRKTRHLAELVAAAL
jgi:hypothetical protein